MNGEKRVEIGVRLNQMLWEIRNEEFRNILWQKT
jgi:hypothetical protein